LTLTNQDEIMAETIWATSGGGLSLYEPTPSFQSNLGVPSRATPDVAFVGDTLTGVAVYDSVGIRGWADMGGSSVGAPAWSGLLAIVGQGRILARRAQLSNAQVALYDIGGGDFNDTNADGYDLFTGRGSPKADLLVRDLVGYTGSTKLPPPLAPATPTSPTGGGWWWQKFIPLAQIGAHAATDAVVGSVDLLPSTSLTSDAAIRSSAKPSASNLKSDLPNRINWTHIAAEIESALRGARRNRFAQHVISQNLAAIDSFFATLKT